MLPSRISNMSVIRGVPLCRVYLDGTDGGFMHIFSHLHLFLATMPRNYMFFIDLNNSRDCIVPQKTIVGIKVGTFSSYQLKKNFHGTINEKCTQYYPDIKMVVIKDSNNKLWAVDRDKSSMPRVILSEKSKYSDIRIVDNSKD